MRSASAGAGDGDCGCAGGGSPGYGEGEVRGAGPPGPRGRYPEAPRFLQGRRDAKTCLVDGAERRGRGQPRPTRRKSSASGKSPSSGPLRLNPFRPCPSASSVWRKSGASRSSPSPKKKGAAGAKEEAEGRVQQEAIRALLLRSMKDELCKNREEFKVTLDEAAASAGYKLGTSTRKAILSALSERDEGRRDLPR